MVPPSLARPAVPGERSACVPSHGMGSGVRARVHFGHRANCHRQWVLWFRTEDVRSALIGGAKESREDSRHDPILCAQGRPCKKGYGKHFVALPVTGFEARDCAVTVCLLHHFSTFSLSLSASAGLSTRNLAHSERASSRRPMPR